MLKGLRICSKNALLAFLSTPLVLWGPLSFASSGITYHGRLLKSDGTPVTSNNVQFKMQIKTPGAEDCLMYEETQTLDLSATNGVFSISVGDGNGTRTDSYSAQWDLFESLSNRHSFSFLAADCTGVTTYTPNQVDNRKFRVFFDDGSGSGWQSMPTQIINYIPMSIETYAVGGFPASSLFRVEDSGVLGSVAALTTTQYNNLVDLADGSSSVYEKSGSLNGSTLPSIGSGESVKWNGTSWESYSPLESGDETDPTVEAFAKTSLPTCAAGEVLKSDGSVLSCVTDTSGTLPDVGTAGTYTKVTTDAKGRVTSGDTLDEADLPNITTAGKVSGDAITSGEISGSTSIDTSGNIVTTGNMTANGDGSTSGVIYGAALQTRRLHIYDDDTNFVTLKTPSNLSGDYALTLPVDAGTSGQVLSTDGSGALSWISPSTGSVTSVTGTSPIVITGTASAPVVTLSNSGVGAATYGSATQVPVFEVDEKGLIQSVTNTTISGVSPVGSTLSTGKAWVGDASGDAQEVYVNVSDLKKSDGTNQIPLTCTDSQTLVYSAVTDLFSCSDIAIAHTQVSGLDAGNISNTPSGNITATDVQSALDELDSDISSLNTDLSSDISSKVSKSGDSMTGALTMNAQNEVRFSDSDSSNYVGFKASASITANNIWTLPESDGTSGQVLSTDGSGVLSWEDNGSGGDVVGAAASTDNAVARYDGTTGKLLQNSALTIGDDGAVVVTSSSSTPFSLGPTGATDPAFKIAQSSAGGGVSITTSSQGATFNSLSSGLPNNLTMNVNGAAGEFKVTTSGFQRLLVNPTGVILGSGATSSVFLSSGNVGIGTTTPERLLHVNGPIRITASTTPSSPATGDIYIDSSDSNKLKWYDGSGWEEAGGGGGSVVGVTGTTPISVDNTDATNPVISVDDATTSAKGVVLLADDDGTDTTAGHVVQASDSRLQDIAGKLANDLAQYKVFVGDASNKAAAQWFGVADLRTSTGAQQFSDANCTSSQTLTWSSLTDAFSCADISGVAASDITNTAAGNIAATDVQAAINELDTEKVAKAGDTMTGVLNLPSNGLVVGTDQVVVSGGNLGIGTATPIAPLHIHRQTGWAELYFTNPSTGVTTNDGLTIGIDPGSDTAQVMNGENTPLKFGTNNTERMRVDGSGNVGIGTTTPGRLLHVDGPMRLTASTVPASPATGDIYVDSSDSNKLKWYDGTGWQTAGGGSGSVSFPLLSTVSGSAAAPAYSFSGDTNTGIFRSAADTLSLAAGGTQAVTVGTDNTKITGGTYALTVQSDDGGVDFMVSGGHGLEMSFYADDSGPETASIANNGGTNEYLTLGVKGTSGTDGIIELQTAGLTRLQIDSDGTVGIGTSNPTALLHVNGPMRLTAATAPSTPATGDIFIDSADSNKLKWYNGSAWKEAGSGTVGAGSVTNTAAGNISATTVQAAINELDTEKVAKAGDTMTGTLNLPTNGLVVGTDQLVANSGNVGIGTASPGQKLDIQGTDSDVHVNIQNSSSTSARYPGVLVQNYTGGVGGAPSFTGLASRGTSGSPAPVQTGDTLFMLNGLGETDTSWHSGTGAIIQMQAAQTFSSTALGTNILFQNVANDSTTLQTRMFIGEDGNVGIGTTSPGANLEVSSAGSTSLQVTATGGGALYPNVKVQNYGTGVPEIMLLNANGTLASPSASAAWDWLGTISFMGRKPAGVASDGTGVGNAGILAETEAAFTNSSHPTRLSFYTTDVSETSSTMQMTITASGDVGIGTSAPDAKLEVVGEIRSVDSTGAGRVWGEGRPGAVRYGTSGVNSGLCTNGSISIGLSRLAVPWGSAGSACPLGTWVCTASERGSGACNTSRPDTTADGVSANGSTLDQSANNHIGWVADVTTAYTTATVAIGENGTTYDTTFAANSYAIWCCSE